jgi:hypothetical protein
MELFEKKRKSLNKKIREEFAARDISIGKSIAGFANRIAKEYISAQESEKQSILAALIILNQAQAVVEIDSNLARKLLATARRTANIKEQE